MFSTLSHLGNNIILNLVLFGRDFFLFLTAQDIIYSILISCFPKNLSLIPEINIIFKN